MPKVKEALVLKYQLHKQHLLDQSPANTVLDVVNDLIALHATSASTPYLSLFARMKQFQRSLLDRELYANRTLIRLKTLRGSLFISSTKMAPMLFQATRMPDARIMQVLQTWGIPSSEYQRIADSVFSILKDGGQPLHIIKQAMSPQLVRMVERQVGNTVSRMTNVNIVLTVLLQQGRVFSEKYLDPILTRQGNRYALIRTVFPHLNLESLDPEDARRQLVILYVARFGPVSEQDIIWWTGLSKGEIQPALAAMDSELQPLRIKNHPDQYLMLASDYAALKKFKAPRHLPVRLLPYEDPYTKGFQIRRLLVNTEYESHAYVGGEAQPTILVNGKIAGIWNRVFEEPSDTITIELFHRLSRGEKNALAEQARVLGHMMRSKEIKVVFRTR